MLKSEKRIKKALFKGFGRPLWTARGKLLSLRVFTHSPGKNVFSVSVSKKIEKSAVIRNKMRRLGYSAIKNNINNVKVGFALAFSWISKFPRSEKNYKDDINNEVVELLSKVKLIK